MCMQKANKYLPKLELLLNRFYEWNSFKFVAKINIPKISYSIRDSTFELAMEMNLQIYRWQLGWKRNKKPFSNRGFTIYSPFE